MKLLWNIFWAFARIGVLTFGGGYAMMPMLQKETIERYGWCTQEELLDYFSLSQCLPGIIAVNVSTFIGTKLAGATGALVAGIGVVTPSFIIILIVALLLGQVTDLSIMNNAFAGIRIGVAALIFHSVLRLSKSSLKTRAAQLIFLGAVLLSVLTSISPIIIVVVAGIIGVLIGVFNSKNKTSGEAGAQ